MPSPLFRCLFLCSALALGAACGSDKAGKNPNKDTPTPAKANPADKANEGALAAAGDPGKRPPTRPADMSKQTIALEKIKTSKPLQIDVPSDFKAAAASEHAVTLQGKDFKLIVEVPAEGIVGLADERQFVATPKAEAFIDEKLADGEALAYKAGDEIYAVVARPKLEVLCSGSEMKTEAHARALIDMCKTLRPVGQGD